MSAITSNIAKFTHPTDQMVVEQLNPSASAQLPKKYECPDCPQKFTRQHNLKSHLLIHSQQEKKFTCEMCSSKFRRIHDLKRHLKLHTGERPYLCKKCGRRFARGDALVRHTKASVACSVSFISLENSKVLEETQQDQIQQENEKSSLHLKQQNSLIPPDDIIKYNSQADYTIKLFSQRPKRSSIAEILSTPTHDNTHLSSLINHSKTSNNEDNHIISSHPNNHEYFLPPLKTKSVQYKVSSSNNELDNIYDRSLLIHQSHYHKGSKCLSRKPYHESSNVSENLEFQSQLSVDLSHKEQLQQQPQQQQHQWDYGFNSAFKDSFFVIKILENRLRALEERLNSTEGRVSLLENQLTSYHY